MFKILLIISFFISQNSHAQLSKQQINIKQQEILQCLKNHKCEMLNSSDQLIASLLIMFSKSLDERYIHHIINMNEFSELPNKNIFWLYIIRQYNVANKIISYNLAAKISKSFKNSFVDYGSIYSFLNIIPNDSDKETIANLPDLVWVNYDFKSNYERDNFYDKYRHYISNDAISQRIDRLLLKNKILEAQDSLIMVNINTSHRNFIEKKIEISRFCNSNDVNIQKLSNINTDEVSINMLLLKCMVEIRRPDLAFKFATKIGDRETFLADAIWKYQKLAVIEALNIRNYDLALNILSASTPRNKEDFVENKWYLGWINLVFLNNPSVAIEHFNTFIKNVKFIVSRSRGYYWIARSFEALGDFQKASEYYHLASSMPTTFYGQEAIYKLNLNLQEEIRVAQVYDKHKDLHNYTWLNVALLLNNYDDFINFTNSIITSYFPIFSKDISTSIMFYISNILGKDRVIPIVRDAAKFGIFNGQISYPKIFPEMSNFISAIIRQESALDSNAVSNKNAMGLMQVIPSTAKLMCKKLGIKYNKTKLLKDKKYNIAIGSAYIMQLMNEFNDSKILTAAAYNAGPAPIKRWLKQNGHIKMAKNSEQIINWIESISYGETKNYVMRIIENDRIYNAIY